MSEVEACVTQINAKYREDDWMPIVYRPQHHQPEAVAHIYRAADLCVVSSLHDGMNLVAKEFIASRSDERGVLVLSEFTGAARELEHAVHVNPFAVDAFADCLNQALLMPGDEQRRRMRALRERVASHTVFDWANSLLTAAANRRMELVR
jgi:trehalose 6-phosphate synthase